MRRPRRGAPIRGRAESARPCRYADRACRAGPDADPYTRPSRPPPASRRAETRRTASRNRRRPRPMRDRRVAIEWREARVPAASFRSFRRTARPSRGRPIVGFLGLDPGAAARALLALPERRAGFEIIHQELGGREGLLAARGRGRDQHDVVSWLEPPVAMDDGDAEQRPAALGFGDMPGNLRLRHLRIMLERDRRDRLARLGAAAHAREGDQRADVGATIAQRRCLRRNVEIFGLQTSVHCNLNRLGPARFQATIKAKRPRQPGMRYPPVIGGKKAISFACPILVSGGTWVRSSAARITRGLAKTLAYSSPRPESQCISSPTVATPAGGSISSCALPIRSRTQAKYRTFTLIPRSDAGPRRAGNPSRYRASPAPRSTAGSGRLPS